MKRKDIFLDFTSLLDVTLILIFFFVIFSQLEGEENDRLTQDALTKYESATQEAEDREEVAGELLEQLKGELEMVRDEDERGGANLEEMLAFAKGSNVKLMLSMDGANWSVKVMREDKVLARIAKDEDVKVRLIEVLQDAGYQAKDTLLCEFIFDGSEAGTASAYRKISAALEGLKGTFAYFYCSETDLSVGEE